MMRRNAGDYVKSWGAATIRGAATNAEFTVITVFESRKLRNVVVICSSSAETFESTAAFL